MDQSSSRPELLACAQKTMFGAQPCRQIVSPPFEVESHLDQNMQCADWIATIVGRIWAYRLDMTGFSSQKPYDDYFWDRLGRVSHQSKIEKRADIPRRPTRKLVATTTTVRTERTIEVLTMPEVVVIDDTK